MAEGGVLGVIGDEGDEEEKGQEKEGYSSELSGDPPMIHLHIPMITGMMTGRLPISFLKKRFKTRRTSSSNSVSSERPV